MKDLKSKFDFVLKQKKSIFNLSSFVGLGLLILLYQNCSQPYDVEVESYVDSPSELALAVQLDPDMVVNDTPYVTKAEFNLRLQKKYAREMLVSQNSECEGDWQDYQDEVKVTWSGKDGPSSIFVKFRNFSKDESECFKVDFVFDTLPPELSFSGGPGPISPHSTSFFTLEFVEEGSEVSRVEYRVDGGTWEVGGRETQVGELSQGVHKIDFRAFDIVGHESNMISYQWEINKNAPLLVFTEKPQYYSNTADARFGFLATENPETGLTGNRFVCKLNGQSESNCSSPVIFVNLNEGPNTLQIKVYDDDNNMSIFKEEWVVDTIEPEVRIVDSPPKLSKSRSSLFTLSGDDTNGSGVSSFECQIDNGNFTPCNSTGQTYQNLAEGEHRFTTRSVDRAGNVSSEKSFIWEVDTEGPAINITSGPPRWSTLSSVTHTYTIQASGAAELVKIECRKAENLNYNSCSPTESTASNLSPGNYQFSIRATDSAGNQTVSNNAFGIDRTKPQFSWTSTPGSQSNASTDRFTYSLTDTQSGMAGSECQIDGEGWKSCSNTSKSYSNLADGAHTFKIKISDNAGNLAYKTYNWTVDRERPDLSITVTPKNTINFGGVLWLQYAGSDNQSSISIKCFLDGQEVTTKCYKKSFVAENASRGQHNIRIEAHDNAGNVAKVYHTFTVN